MELINLIENYVPYDEVEMANKESFLYFLKSFKEQDRTTRENVLGHLTASSWIVNKDRSKVLFAHHNMYDSRAWLGGHADGDLDLLKVAEKEAKEESWLENIIVLQNSPIDINTLWVHEHIKRWKVVSTHLHLNVVYLFQADENDKIMHAEWENSAVERISIDEVLDRVSEEHMKPIYARVMEKVKKL